MSLVTINTTEDTCLPARVQSFTFLVVDSLPLAIFVPHVSYSRDSPVHRRDIWLSLVVKVQIFEGHECVGNQLSWAASRKELSRSPVDPTNIQ